MKIDMKIVKLLHNWLTNNMGTCLGRNIIFLDIIAAVVRLFSTKVGTSAPAFVPCIAPSENIIPYKCFLNTIITLNPNPDPQNPEH